MPNALAFVDRIATSGVVTVLDLNDRVAGGFYLDTIDAPPPPLRRSLSDSLLGNGQRLSASAYDNRTVSLKFAHLGTSDQTSLAIQALHRVIDQPESLLRWTPTGATNPVWFRVLRSSVSSIREELNTHGVRQLAVDLMCMPAAYGLPVSIAAFTITNRPDSGTNRMMVGPSTVTELDDIKGDLETPLLLAQTTGPGITVDSGGVAGYLSSYALRGTTHALLARSLSELTSGTDVGANVTGAGTNYIDGDYKSCSFTNTASMQRLFGTFTTALTPMPGLFRLLLRVVAPSGIGSQSGLVGFMIKVRTDGSVAFTELARIKPTVTWNNAADTAHLLDFGVVQLPPGAATGQVGLTAAATAGSAPYWAIYADELSLLSAPKAIRFDEMFLLPVDTNYGDAAGAIIDFPTYSASLPNNVLVYDGINDQMRTLYDASGTAPFAGIPVTATAMNYLGGLPMVRPGCNNYVTFIYNAAIVTGTSVFAGLYYPQYLYVAPAAT